jgi:hypothetical protein
MPTGPAPTMQTSALSRIPRPPSSKIIARLVEFCGTLATAFGVNAAICAEMSLIGLMCMAGLPAIGVVVERSQLDAELGAGLGRTGQLPDLTGEAGDAKGRPR